MNLPAKTNKNIRISKNATKTNLTSKDIGSLMYLLSNFRSWKKKAQKTLL